MSKPKNKSDFVNCLKRPQEFKVKQKETEKLINKLVEECRKDETYSVIEATEKMGIDYKQVQKWVRSDERIADALNFCRECCACNAEIAGLTEKISCEDFEKYMCENDDRFKERLEKQKSKDWFTDKERKIKDIAERVSVVINDKNKIVASIPA